MQVKMNRTERNAVSDIPVSFRASNITGTQSLPVEVIGGL